MFQDTGSFFLGTWFRFAFRSVAFQCRFQLFDEFLKPTVLNLLQQSKF